MAISKDDALRALGLEGQPTPSMIEAAVAARRTSLEQRLNTAVSPDQAEQYRRKLQALDAVRLTLLENASADRLPISRIPSSHAFSNVGDDLTRSEGWITEQARDVMILKEGDTLAAGRYRIEELIGAGGMGAVYRAYDHNREKDIAIKVLLPSMLSRKEIRDRFLREARLSSEMSHPNIVTAFDVQQESGYTFMTMELLKGQTLRNRLKQLKQSNKPIELKEAIEIIDQVTQGLAYAHAKNIVHRDIKPDNVWIEADGRIKLMDFGVARLLVGTNMTHSFMAIGTMHYMAPEQTGGMDIDGRADQYSTAVMLYEMLAGAVPTLRSEPILKIRKDISKKLSDSIDRAMSGNREQRFQDISLFRAAILKSLNDKRASNGVQWAAAGLGGVIAIGGIIHYSMNSSHEVDDHISVNQSHPMITTGVPAQNNIQSQPLNIGPEAAVPMVAQNESIVPVKPTVLNEPFRDCPECPELIPIQPGNFSMGSSLNETGRDSDESPQSEATISTGFAMGRYEVTRAQFAEFIRATNYPVGNSCWGIENGIIKELSGLDWKNPGFTQEDNEPVVCVNHADVTAYAAWLSEKTGKSYRLPTELEWEYAARGGTNSARYWPNDNEREICKAANVLDTKWQSAGFGGKFATCSDGYKFTAPVGHFSPNKFGLYDMLGNVSEWTCSMYAATYNGSERKCDSATESKTLRGGSWGDGVQRIRSAARMWYAPSTRDSFVGFRLVREG